MPRTFRFPQDPWDSPQEGDVYINERGAVGRFVGGDWTKYAAQTLEEEGPQQPWPTPPAVPNGTTLGPERFGQGPAMVEDQHRIDALRRATETSGLGFAGPPAPPPQTPPLSPQSEWLLAAGRIAPEVIGSIGGGVIGGLPGAAVGGAGGAALGEYTMEQAEKRMGLRTDTNPLQVGFQAALGAVPIQEIKALKALKGLGGVAARVGAGSAQGAALSAPAAAGREWAEAEHEGRPFTLEEAAEAAKPALLPGAVLGAGFRAPKALGELQDVSRQATLRRAFKGLEGYAIDPITQKPYALLPLPSRVEGAAPVVVAKPITPQILGVLKQAWPDLLEQPMPGAKAAAPTPVTQGLLPPEFAPLPLDVPPATPPPSGIPGPSRGGQEGIPNDITAFLNKHDNLGFDSPYWALERIRQDHQWKQTWNLTNEDPEILGQIEAFLRTPTPAAPPSGIPGATKGQQGAINPDLLSGLGGAVVGGVTGNLIPDSEEGGTSRIAKTLIGAGAGFAAGAGGGRMLRGTPKTALAGTSAAEADLLTPNRIGAGETRHIRVPSEKVGKQLATLPATLWRAVESSLDRDYDLAAKPTFFAAARPLFGNARSAIGSVARRARTTTVNLFTPRGLPPELTEGLDGAELFAFGQFKRQVGVVQDYERQAGRNQLRAQQGQPPEPIKLEGLEGATPAAIDQAYQDAATFAQTTWDRMKPATRALHDRLTAHLEAIGQERVTSGGMSQQTLDRLTKDPRPWMRYWPAYVVDEDAGIKDFYYGGDHPARQESLGREMFREGRTERTLTDPIAVIHRYTSAWEADKIRTRFTEQLADQYDPTLHNPAIKLKDKTTWPLGYDEYVTPTGRAASSTTDPLTDITTPSKKERYLLPSEIIRNLNRMQARVGNPDWEKSIKAVHTWNRLHKAAILHPLTIGAAYDVSNLIGDGVMTFLQTPLARWPAQAGATVDSLRFMLDESSNPTLAANQDALGLGGVSGELTRTLMQHPSIQSMREPLVRAPGESTVDFQWRKFSRGVQAASAPGTYWTHELRRYREGVFRNAKFLERMGAGLPPEEAAHVTRNMLVDYDSLSPEESKYLKGVMFPFWTFAGRTLQKLVPSLSRDPITGSKVDGAFNTLSIHSKGAAAHLLLMSFNEAMFPEAEQRLEDWQRQLPHVNVPVGVFEDGGLELATIFFGGKEIVEKGLADTPTLGPTLRLMNWVTSQAEKVKAADYDPNQGVRFLWLGAPTPRSIAGNLAGVGGIEQRLFDKAAGLPSGDDVVPSLPEAASKAWDAWSGLLSSAITIPALTLGGVDVRGRRSGVGKGLPWFQPGSWNPLAEGTYGGEISQAGLRQTPGVSMFLRGVQASDDEGSDWQDLGVKAIIGSFARLSQARPQELSKRTRQMVEAIGEAQDLRTAEDRHNATADVVATWMTTADGKQMIQGPAYFDGPEGLGKFATAFDATYQMPNKSDADTLRSKLVAIARNKRGGDLDATWRELYKFSHLAQMASHASKEARALYARKQWREQTQHALGFVARMLGPKAQMPQTPHEQTAEANQLLEQPEQQDPIREWLKQRARDEAARTTVGP